jgi:hypothetical protein
VNVAWDLLGTHWMKNSLQQTRSINANFLKLALSPRAACPGLKIWRRKKISVEHILMSHTVRGCQGMSPAAWMERQCNEFRGHLHQHGALKRFQGAVCICVVTTSSEDTV